MSVANIQTLSPACYHGVRVHLQLVRGDGLPVLEEEVLEEALKGTNNREKLLVGLPSWKRYLDQDDAGALVNHVRATSIKCCQF